MTVVNFLRALRGILEREYLKTDAEFEPSRIPSTDAERALWKKLLHIHFMRERLNRIFPDFYALDFFQRELDKRLPMTVREALDALREFLKREWHETNAEFERLNVPPTEPPTDAERALWRKLDQLLFMRRDIRQIILDFHEFGFLDREL